MQRIFLLATLTISFLFLGSCASGYKAIHPESQSYVSTTQVEEVEMGYKYQYLKRKYAKKADKKNIKIAAVKLTNNSQRDLVIGRDLLITFGDGKVVSTLPPESMFQELKQNTIPYLLYLLLTPVSFNITKTYPNGVQETTGSIPVGLIIGPGLAAGNMLTAGNANKKFKTNLLENDLYGQTIQPGETKYGIIGFSGNSFESLTLKIVNNDQEELPDVTENK